MTGMWELITCHNCYNQCHVINKNKSHTCKNCGVEIREWSIKEIDFDDDLFKIDTEKSKNHLISQRNP